MNINTNTPEYEKNQLFFHELLHTAINRADWRDFKEEIAQILQNPKFDIFHIPYNRMLPQILSLMNSLDKVEFFINNGFKENHKINILSNYSLEEFPGNLILYFQQHFNTDRKLSIEEFWSFIKIHPKMMFEEVSYLNTNSEEVTCSTIEVVIKGLNEEYSMDEFLKHIQTVPVLVSYIQNNLDLQRSIFKRILQDYSQQIEFLDNDNYDLTIPTENFQYTKSMFEKLINKKIQFELEPDLIPRNISKYQRSIALINLLIETNIVNFYQNKEKANNDMKEIVLEAFRNELKLLNHFNHLENRLPQNTIKVVQMYTIYLKKLPEACSKLETTIFDQTFYQSLQIILRLFEESNSHVLAFLEDKTGLTERDFSSKYNPTNPFNDENDDAKFIDMNFEKIRLQTNVFLNEKINQNLLNKKRMVL